jgi:3-oxo-5alpha-steroid 4-dehydrogenase
MKYTAQEAQKLGAAIEDPLVVADPETFPWDETADLVVVGLGGAGVAASLEGLERGLSVIAVDRYEGGGSTAANGGIFYAGGGTRIQKEAGEEDSPEEMYKYLKIEVGDVVSDATLHKFVDESVETVDWILEHGGKLNSKVWKKKASYPPLDYFLYHPDNSLVSSYVARAKPAARGHRAFTRNGKKAWGLGIGIWGPLRDSAMARGLQFHRYSEARQLARDPSGRVVGVKILSIPPARRRRRASAATSRGPTSFWRCCRLHCRSPRSLSPSARII